VPQYGPPLRDAAPAGMVILADRGVYLDIRRHPVVCLFAKINIVPSGGCIVVVTGVSKDQPIAVPKWDVALAALMREEYQKTGNALKLDDLRRLSGAYAIRFDDIVVTAFELCLYGEWQYRAANGTVREMTREIFAELTSAGRLKDRDLVDFDGGWSPLQ